MTAPVGRTRMPRVRPCRSGALSQRPCCHTWQMRSASRTGMIAREAFRTEGRGLAHTVHAGFRLGNCDRGPRCSRCCRAGVASPHHAHGDCCLVGAAAWAAAMNPSGRVVLGRPGDRTAVLIRRTIGLAVGAIAALAFAFSFGNAWILGLQLGVPHWVAPLPGPAVDLSVLALLVSMQYVRAQGAMGRLVGPRLLLVFCGLVTLVINVAKALIEGQYGRAAYDSVSPLLLVFWGEVGPGLLALLHRSVLVEQDESSGPHAVVRDGPDEPRTAQSSTRPSAELIARARELDSAHRDEAGRPISRDRLRAAMGVSNALAGELVRIVRTRSQDGESG
jgi:hypothetical protein